MTSKLNELALQILGGLDWRKLPRFADEVDRRDAQGEAAVSENDRKIGRKQLDRLNAHGISHGP